MREGEVLGLTWDCIDFESGTITIKQQLQKVRGSGGDYVLVSTKNGKTRIISPASYVMQVLTGQRKAQNMQIFPSSPSLSRTTQPIRLVIASVCRMVRSCAPAPIWAM